MFKRIARRSILGSILFLCLVVCQGCSGKTSGVRVQGKVLFQDRTPLTKGSVQFHPDDQEGNEFGGIPIGTINESGSYTLFTNGKEGAPAGKYRVTVHSSEPSDPKNEYSLPRSLINHLFANPKTTTLKVEVKAGAPEGAYDLTVVK